MFSLGRQDMIKLCLFDPYIQWKFAFMLTQAERITDQPQLTFHRQSSNTIYYNPFLW